MIKKWIYRLRIEYWFYLHNKSRPICEKSRLTKSAVKELINNLIGGKALLLFGCASYPLCLARKACEYLGIKTEVVGCQYGFELRRVD